MSARRVTLAGLWLLALLVGGCGEPATPTIDQLLLKLDSPDPRLVDAAVDLLGQRGREEPERIIPRLIARLEAEHERGRVLGIEVQPDLSAIPEGAARSRVKTALLEVVSERLRHAGLPVPLVRQEGELIIALLSLPVDPAHVPQVLEHALRAVEATAGMRLRGEVPPPFAVTPDRPVSPWDGDLDAYRAWLAEDRRRLEASWAPGGPLYEPQDARYRVLRVRPGPEAPDVTSVPVRLPPAGLIDPHEGMVHVVVDTDRGTGAPSVQLVPQGDRVEPWNAFLRAHAGLKLWLVLGGEAVLPVHLGLKPSGTLSFPVRGETVDQARQRALELATSVGMRSLPCPVSVRPLERPTSVRPDAPAARALARLGMAASPALDQLVAKDKAWQPFVERLREALVRTEATGGAR